MTRFCSKAHCFRVAARQLCTLTVPIQHACFECVSAGALVIWLPVSLQSVLTAEAQGRRLDLTIWLGFTHSPSRARRAVSVRVASALNRDMVAYVWMRMRTIQEFDGILIGTHDVFNYVLSMCTLTVTSNQKPASNLLGKPVHHIFMIPMNINLIIGFLLS